MTIEIIVQKTLSFDVVLFVMTYDNTLLVGRLEPSHYCIVVPDGKRLSIQSYSLLESFQYILNSVQQRFLIQLYILLDKAFNTS